MENFPELFLDLVISLHIGEKCVLCGFEYKDIQTFKSKKPRRAPPSIDSTGDFTLCCDECYTKLMEERTQWRAKDARLFKCEEVYQKLSKAKKLSEKERKLLSELSHMRTQMHLPTREIEDPYSSHGLYFDWDGTEIKLWEWTFKIEYMKQHVAKDTIDGRFISTVWLGLNHGWSGEIAIFETMIFAEADSGENLGVQQYQDRYSTYEEALEGHKKACEWVKNGEK